MMDRILKRQINGSEYTITPLAAGAGGLDNYRKLQKFMAPVLGQIFRAIGESKDLDTAAPGMAQSIVLTLGSSMGDPEFCALLDRMFGACAFRGGPIPPNHWDTHLADHDELVGCCLWVNFILPFAVPKLRLLGVDTDKLLGSLKIRPTSTP